MTASSNTSTIAPEIPTDLLLAEAVKAQRAGMGVRELSRASGVAAAQITRLEKGEVRKPAANTLVQLARALSINPGPLLILAGYIDGEAARAHLRVFYAKGTEFEQEWLMGGQTGQKELESARAVLEDPNVSEEQLRQLAYHVATSGETGETLWDDAYLALGAQGPRARELQELVSLWPHLETERQQLVLRFVRDLVKLQNLELAETLREEEAETQRQVAAVVEERSR